MFDTQSMFSAFPSLRHPQEPLSKATGVHAAVLCPAQVSIHNFPADLDRCVAEWGDADTTVLLFPSADATPVCALSAAQLARVRRAVFIDSTWQQARSIWNDPRVAAWPKVAIESQRTRFWRYHELGDHCLSTIEAIYHLCREWHTRETGSYAGVDRMVGGWL